MTVDDQLSILKKKRDEVKTQIVQTETILQQLEQEKVNLLDECSKLNVDPKKIKEVIQDSEMLLNQELALLRKELDEFNVR